MRQSIASHEITQQSSRNNNSTGKNKNYCIAAVSASVRPQLISMSTLTVKRARSNDATIIICSLISGETKGVGWMAMLQKWMSL